MYNDKYIHDFIKILSRDYGITCNLATNYEAEDAYLLRAVLRKPLYANPNEIYNTDIEALSTLTHSLVNGKNLSGEYLASCYVKAKNILDKLGTDSGFDDPSFYLCLHNGDALYEIAKLLESPLNVVAARLYGKNSSNRLIHTADNEFNHQDARVAA